MTEYEKELLGKIKQLQAELKVTEDALKEYRAAFGNQGLFTKLQTENAQQVICITALEKVRDELRAENEKHRWIPISEQPDNDTYYLALIGDTGDEFGNTIEWLRFDEIWFYAKTKKPYPRATFIIQYKKSLQESEPKGGE